ncbi:hypothetical protein P667_1734 [Acinetobacter baumannii UH5107]|nr:hypothetical protein P667_1734 [Acinetobacter baumannii UH5107]
MQVCFKKLLEEVGECNEIIYGEGFLINQVNLLMMICLKAI